MKFSLEHIGLAARDPRALKEWYQRMLGAELVYEMRQTPPAYLLNLGGVLVEIYAAEFSSEETRKNRLAGWRHIALKVDSLDAAKAELEARGLQFTETAKPAGGGGRVLFFSDPEGNLVHFTERLPGGFQ
jgi:catechol 2,3-dioxygenase-like lactoylglutathione lyase family enzyme